MGYKKSNVGLGLGNLSGLSTYNTSLYASKIAGQSEYQQFEHAEVVEIDLNPERPENVGRVKFRFMHTLGQDSNALSWAFPLAPYYRMYPVIGELIVVTEFDGRFYWLSVLNVLNTLNNNLQTNISDRNAPQNGQATATDYKETQASGIPNSESEKSGKPGETFKNQRMKIGILSPNEGDVVIEGRFSNSIRLGNNPETNFPNIKISVREALESFAIDKEDIDKHSCIFITSDEILTFNPIGIPISDVNNPPEKYDGKQILICSDRIILGSKLNEILIFSNKTISLASLDNFSVDTDKKIVTHTELSTEMYTKDQFWITADKNIQNKTKEQFLVESDKNSHIKTKQQFLVEADKEAKLKALKVMIGKNNADEPLVLGNKWKDAMITLIDVLLNHIHPTGTGPSGPMLPPHKANLETLKQRVNRKEHLSDDNFTTKKNG